MTFSDKISFGLKPWGTFPGPQCTKSVEAVSNTTSHYPVLFMVWYDVNWHKFTIHNLGLRHNRGQNEILKGAWQDVSNTLTVRSLERPKTKLVLIMSLISDWLQITSKLQSLLKQSQISMWNSQIHKIISRHIQPRDGGKRSKAEGGNVWMSQINYKWKRSCTIKIKLWLTDTEKFAAVDSAVAATLPLSFIPSRNVPIMRALSPTTKRRKTPLAKISAAKQRSSGRMCWSGTEWISCWFSWQKRLVA